MNNIFLVIIEVLLFLVPVLISVAFLTLFERKVLASIQKRVGPNLTGLTGLLQALADALKLVLKESIIPTKSNSFIFIASSISIFSLSLLSWSVIPFGYCSVFSDINYGILFIFSISSLSVYAVIMSGWSSNSRYAFLGSLRSASQMISYEVSFGLLIMNVLICVGSLNFHSIIMFQQYIWFVVPLSFITVLFFVSSVAETNRSPFDLPEAEGELVAGYNVEYSAVMFALFFIAEYANILLMSVLIVIFFFGGWLSPSYFYLSLFDFVFIPWFLLFFLSFSFVPSTIWLSLKVGVFIFFFIWIRATFPRYRYDQLMRLGWKVILPLSLGFLSFNTSVLIIFDYYPTLY